MANTTSALELLRSEKATLAIRLQAVERAIHELERTSVGAENGIAVSNDDFSGMKIVDATAKLLGKLGRPAHLYKEILPTLRRGGCNLGEQENRYPATLKIAVRMNSKPQHQLAYDETHDLVALRPQPAGSKKRRA